MATTAHCIYCFEVIHASFEDREPMRLAEVESTWQQYQDSLRPPPKQHSTLSPSPAEVPPTTLQQGEVHEENDQPSTTEDDDEEDAQDETVSQGGQEEAQEHTAPSPTKRPKRRRKSLLSVPNLLHHRQQTQPQPSSSRSQLLRASEASGSGSGSSASSTPSLQSSASASTSTSTSQTPASSTSLSNTSASSSRSSLPTPSTASQKPITESPMFVTWNTVSKSSYTGRTHKSLRGCIGTFESQMLERGLRNYARLAAFEDTRFSPLPPSVLTTPLSSSSTPSSTQPQLHCALTLLLDFQPCLHPLDWTLGTHGIRISFTEPHHRRRLGSTYLPDVPVEQGWSKSETLVSLMRKAGWDGRSREWEDVARKGNMEVVRYRGVKSGVGVGEWAGWRRWVDGRL